MTTCLFRSSWLVPLLMALLSNPLSAAIVQTGGVYPPVNAWTNSTPGYVGYASAGSVTVDAGSLLASGYGYLGYHEAGAATVTGVGSKWINSNHLQVGDYGAGTLGTLTVSDGGEVVTGTLIASLSDLHGNGTITATAGAVLDVDFTFDAAHGALQSFAFGSGGTLNVTVGVGAYLGAGHNESGNLTISEGVNVFSGVSYLGYWPGSTGAATVTGVGSKWVSSYSLQVGNHGAGTLMIEAEGEVRSTNIYLAYESGATGAATVTGAGSKLTGSTELSVGHYGAGTLTIEAGAEVTNGAGRLGYNSGSTGAATVTGAGSKWTNGSRLDVGDRGSGILLIEAGGLVSSSSGYLANVRGTTGTVTVTGAGSKWTNSVDLRVGNYGAGTLTIKAGGQVSSFGGDLGYGFDGVSSAGTVTVTGAGSNWANSSALYVGVSGTGTLLMEAGGQVSNTVGYLGLISGSTGTVTVTGAGSKWSNSSALNVGRFGSGTLTIKDGGLVRVGGTLTIDNSSFINMSTGGILALYGDADDSLSQFLGLVQGTDAIRFWDSSLSAWAPLASATLGVNYLLEYLTVGDLAGYTLLTVGEAISSGLPGDYNGNGIVDAADYVVWRAGGSPDSTLAGYNLWRANFGKTAGSGAGAAANSSQVPEPASIVLGVSVLGLVSCLRRERRARR